MKKLKPDTKYGIEYRWEHNGYWIEIWVTAMGSFRVSCRRPYSYTMIANWCAGSKVKHVKQLMNALIDCIDNLEEFQIPLMSRIKPYFNDSEFLQFIEKHDSVPVDFEFSPSTAINTLITSIKKRRIN